MVVDSDGFAPEGHELDDEGLLNIPFSAVRSVKDMVMVQL